MDDPWGSPWATNEPKPPSPSKSLHGPSLEPPPRAFLSTSSSPRIPAISGPSPWADDDDGFGDWSVPEPTSNSQSGWGGGGWGGSETDKSPRLTPTPRDEGFGKASPIAWPGSIALPKPTSGSTFRQPSPSPDPWASEFAWNASPSVSDDLPTPRLPPDGSDTGSNAPKEDKQDITPQLEPKWGEELSQHDVGDEAADTGGAAAPEPEALQNEREESKTDTKAGKDVPGDSLESPQQEGDSRRSSSSGDDSEPDVDRQDSPITSIDEDSRARLQVPRKTSGKVQQLVERYDGITRSASEEPPAPVRVERGRSRGVSPFPATAETTETVSDDGADFGDFEDVDEGEDVQESFKSSPAALPERTPTPGATRSKRVDSVASLAEEQLSDSPSRVSQLVSQFGEIKFDISLDGIEKLFDRLPQTTDDVDGAEADVTDRIITDSFTEISERKTWYRVSRQGSSRKYNAGDDDNYRRVAWPVAEIRLDTIKIVRRWLEQDSIAGRPTLGGAVSRSNMFGWDTKSEPVSLEKVFGKKGKSHSRAASLHQHQPHHSISASTGTTSRKASVTPNSPTQRPLSMGVAPVPSFGWSSGGADNSSSANPIPPPAPPVVVKQPVESLPKPSVSPPRANVPPPPPSTKKEPPASLQLKEEDDDDDWGEMVSSPQEVSAPTGGMHGLGFGSIQTTSNQTKDSSFTMLPTQQVSSSTAPPPTHLNNDPWGEMVSSPQEAFPPTGSVLGFGLESVHNATSQPQTTSFTPLPARQMPSSTAPPRAEAESDPWGSVDFSFFDKPAAAPKQTTAPIAPQEVANVRSRPGGADFTPMSSPTWDKHPTPTPPAAARRRKVTFDEILSPPEDNTFTPTTPIAILSPIPLSATTPTSPYPSSIGPDDEAAQSIIRSLPNLSYMLRP